ncbi:MAG: hypothetical protein F6K54_27740 [Okeania sp. SIO3B5]|nr:hypothetical protein [Okeania sp. SIO3B5]NEO56536.1 hypothetical protein [Okeania sp. SIO3B5]
MIKESGVRSQESGGKKEEERRKKEEERGGKEENFLFVVGLEQLKYLSYN